MKSILLLGVCFLLTSCTLPLLRNIATGGLIGSGIGGVTGALKGGLLGGALGGVAGGGTGLVAGTGAGAVAGGAAGTAIGAAGGSVIGGILGTIATAGCPHGAVLGAAAGGLVGAGLGLVTGGALGGTAGAVGGTVGGAALGGIGGAVVGAPVGAVGGAVAGAVAGGVTGGVFTVFSQAVKNWNCRNAPITGRGIISNIGNGFVDLANNIRLKFCPCSNRIFGWNRKNFTVGDQIAYGAFADWKDYWAQRVVVEGVEQPSAPSVPSFTFDPRDLVQNPYESHSETQVQQPSCQADPQPRRDRANSYRNRFTR